MADMADMADMIDMVDMIDLKLIFRFSHPLLRSHGKLDF
jgi:hypothetical protein